MHNNRVDHEEDQQQANVEAITQRDQRTHRRPTVGKHRLSDQTHGTSGARRIIHHRIFWIIARGALDHVNERLGSLKPTSARAENADRTEMTRICSALKDADAVMPESPDLALTPVTQEVRHFPESDRSGMRSTNRRRAGVCLACTCALHARLNGQAHRSQ